MKNQLTPIIALALFSPLFAELLSGNILLFRLLQPVTFILLIISYSFPVLLIRELFVRYKLGLPALFLLGLTYGIYNEGIIAKTFLLAQNVPISAFDHYGFFWGINWTWLINMTTIHAAISVIFPILIISIFSPEQSKKPWLSKTSVGILFALFVGLGILSNLSKGPIGMFYAGVFATAIVLLTIGALLLGSRGQITNHKCAKPKKMVIMGVALWIFFELIVILLAGFKVPLLVYFGYEFLALLIVYWILHSPTQRTEQTIAFAGLGFYLAMAVWRTGIGFFQLGLFQLESIVVGLLFIVTIFLIINFISKKKVIENLQIIENKV